MLVSVTPPFLDQKNDLIHTAGVGNQVPHFGFVHKDHGMQLFPVCETITRKILQPLTSKTEETFTSCINLGNCLPTVHQVSRYTYFYDTPRTDLKKAAF